MSNTFNDPMLAAELVRTDREQAYLLFATFCGAPVPVAKALGVSPQAVMRMAAEGGWAEKLRPILELHQGAAKPADVERAVNRALNWVQANRLRIVIERTVKLLYGLTAEELEAQFTESAGEGRTKFSVRVLADLAAAMEKAQMLTYAALNDTATERGKRGPEPEGLSASALQAQVSQAMDAVLRDQSPRAQMFDAQLEIAQNVREQAKA